MIDVHKLDNQLIGCVLIQQNSRKNFEIQPVFVLMEELKIKYPEIVIKFYENHILWMR